MPRYGLIGYPLGHSFSQRYFTEKFAREGLADCRYDLFPLPDVAELPALLEQYAGELRGLNVTIPHKQTVLPYLTGLDDTARAIGAVNTVAIRGAERRGYNTDAHGFEHSLRTWLANQGVHPNRRPLRAFVLGSGGAAQAVRYVLGKLGIGYEIVSRRPQAAGQISYDDLPAKLAGTPGQQYLWINTTPLGMYPDVKSCPPLPFDHLSTEHLVYDLVYNPTDTVLLQHAAARGAAVKNGLEMLYLQAERAWEIWQEY